MQAAEMPPALQHQQCCHQSKPWRRMCAVQQTATGRVARYQAEASDWILRPTVSHVLATSVLHHDAHAIHFMHVMGPETNS
jgi:hypothetical protein